VTIPTQPTKPIVPTRRGRPAEKSVQARVIDACADHWLAAQPKGAQAIRNVRIPGAGLSELLLLPPKSGTLLVVGRSWPHAAAFAHMAGQAVGDLAHLLNLAHAQEGELEISAEPGVASQSITALKARIAADAAAGDVGLVFAVGYTDTDGEIPIRNKLHPVLAMLHRWATLDANHIKRGLHLWTVRLAEKNSVEPVQVESTGGGKKKK
jgi:hypothetical protein